jgi:hypothetical protein
MADRNLRHWNIGLLAEKCMEIGLLPQHAATERGTIPRDLLRSVENVVVMWTHRMRYTTGSDRRM